MGISWSEWKQKNKEKQNKGKVSPVDFFNPETEYAPVEVIGRRIKICEDCDQYLASKQCRECGCFMPLKTRLQMASCPLGKW